MKVCGKNMIWEEIDLNTGFFAKFAWGYTGIFKKQAPEKFQIPITNSRGDVGNTAVCIAKQTAGVVDAVILQIFGKRDTHLCFKSGADVG